MQISDIDLIVAIRGIRKLIVLFDSIGLPVQDLLEDSDMKKMIPKDLDKKINSIASNIHNMLQKIEHGKRYKDAVVTLCGDSEKKTSVFDKDDYNG